jgi:hypothetical protein
MKKKRRIEFKEASNGDPRKGKFLPQRAIQGESKREGQ